MILKLIKDLNHNIVENFDINDILEIPQEFSSAKTSINSTKMPQIYSKVNFEPGSVVLDYGGGKFDNAIEYLKQKDVTLCVYDPYNRSPEYNRKSLEILHDNDGADAAVNANVLNVIKEKEVRLNVLNNIKKILKIGAPVYIWIYPGDGSGEGKETADGYQLNRKMKDYMEEITSIFPNATRHGPLVVATKD